MASVQDTPASAGEGDRVALRAGFLAGDLADLASLQLAGSRCGACGIALFGERHRCENCSSPDLTHTRFAATGSVYTYTIQRYPPPPPHSLPDPWEPRPVAWIDIDDGGPRVLAPIRCTPEEVGIGLRVTLDCQVGWTDQAGAEVVDFAFLPLAETGDAA